MPSDLEKVIDIARAGEKGSWFGGDNKFELGCVEFKVSEGDKWLLWRKLVDHPARG